jgi:hypothetical protein
MSKQKKGKDEEKPAKMPEKITDPLEEEGQKDETNSRDLDTPKKEQKR